MNMYQVVSIPSEKNDLRDALGISKERSDFFLEKIKKEYEVETNISDMLEMISAFAKNINESSYVSYVIGRIHAQQTCNKCMPSMPPIGIMKLPMSGELAKEFKRFIDRLMEDEDDD